MVHAKLTAEGKLHIETYDETTAYALKKWVQDNVHLVWSEDLNRHISRVDNLVINHKKQDPL